MTRAIVTGSDPEGIGASLEQAGASVERVEGPVTAGILERRGIDATALFVLTDPEEATAIPLARELQPDVRIVAYTHTSLPDFATHQADLVVAPNAIDQAVLVEELLQQVGPG